MNFWNTSLLPVDLHNYFLYSWNRQWGLYLGKLQQGKLCKRYNSKYCSELKFSQLKTDLTAAGCKEDEIFKWHETKAMRRRTMSLQENLACIWNAEHFLLVIEVGLWVSHDVAGSPSHGMGGFIQGLLEAGVHEVPHHLPGHKGPLHLWEEQKCPQLKLAVWEQHEAQATAMRVQHATAPCSGCAHTLALSTWLAILQSMSRLSSCTVQVTRSRVILSRALWSALSW